MYIYLIEQNVIFDWDIYDSAVVVAPDIHTARFTHPNGESIWNGKTWVNKKTQEKPFGIRAMVLPHQMLMYI